MSLYSWRLNNKRKKKRYLDKSNLIAKMIGIHLTYNLIIRISLKRKFNSKNTRANKDCKMIIKNKRVFNHHNIQLVLANYNPKQFLKV